MPSDGCVFTWAGSNAVISVCTSIVSSGSPFARAVTWRHAVTYPIGLKRPAIHTDGGGASVLSTHSFSCLTRSSRSANHAPSGLRL